MLWRSEDLLRNGPLVIVFYRGRWCAYCNTQLAALQEIHSQIAAVGASLVAISPQTQKHSYLTRDMHKLGFPILSDAGNGCRQNSLDWFIACLRDLQKMYESIMTKLPGYNGDQSWELPLAATYIVQPSGRDQLCARGCGLACAAGAGRDSGEAGVICHPSFNPERSEGSLWFRGSFLKSRAQRGIATNWQNQIFEHMGEGLVLSVLVYSDRRLRNLW